MWCFFMHCFRLIFRPDAAVLLIHKTLKPHVGCVKMIFLWNSRSFSSFSESRLLNLLRNKWSLGLSSCLDVGQDLFAEFAINWCWQYPLSGIAEELINLDRHEVYLQYSLHSSHFFVSLARERYEVEYVDSNIHWIDHSVFVATKKLVWRTLNQNLTFLKKRCL